MFLCSFLPPLPPIFTLRLYFTTLRFRFPLFLHCTGVSSPPHPPLTFPQKKNLLSNAAVARVRERKKSIRRDCGDATLMSMECLCTQCLIPCVIFMVQVQVIPPILPSFNSLAILHTHSLFVSSSLPIWRVPVNFSAGYMSIILQVEREGERPNRAQHSPA